MIKHTLHTLIFKTWLWLSMPLQCSAVDPLDTCNMKPESQQPKGSPAVEIVNVEEQTGYRWKQLKKNKFAKFLLQKQRPEWVRGKEGEGFIVRFLHALEKFRCPVALIHERAWCLQSLLVTGSPAAHRLACRVVPGLRLDVSVFFGSLITSVSKVTTFRLSKESKFYFLNAQQWIGEDLVLYLY